MFRVLLLLVASLIAESGSVLAQSKLDCPRPVRERRYRRAAQMPGMGLSGARMYLELSAGIARPVLYRNAAGSAGDNFRYIARPTPFASATGYLVLGEKLEAYVGASIMQSWQGLGFEHSYGVGQLKVESFAGTLVASLPFGLRYRASDRFWLSAGPYFSIASHDGTTGSSGSSGTVSGSIYDYRTVARNGLNFGLRLGTDVQITKRFGVALSLSADVLQTTESYGSADFGAYRGAQFEGQMRPYLIHAAAGLSYKLWYRAD